MLILILVHCVLQDDFVMLEAATTPAKLLINDSKSLQVQVGYINPSGQFVSEGVIAKTPIIWENPASNSATSMELNAASSNFSKQKLSIYKDVINQQWRRNEKLYEYRSGMLIPGQIDANFSFVPDEGGVVISIKTYLERMNRGGIYDLDARHTRPPGPLSVEVSKWQSDFEKQKEAALKKNVPTDRIEFRRIYNLPGKFVRTSQYEAEKLKQAGKPSRSQVEAK